VISTVKSVAFGTIRKNLRIVRRKILCSENVNILCVIFMKPELSMAKEDVFE